MLSSRLILPEYNAADRSRPAAVFINFKQARVEFAAALLPVKPRRHIVLELVDDDFRYNAEYRVLRSGHTEIGNVAGAVRKYLLVCGLNMGMCAGDNGYAAVEVKTDRPLFGSRLRVKINNDYLAVLEFFQNFVGDDERVFYGIHIHGSHKIYHADFYSALVKDAVSVSRNSLEIVRGTKEAFRLIKELIRFSATERVVARGYDVCAVSENLLRRDNGHTVAVCGIFTVYYADVHSFLSLEGGQKAAKQIKPRRADYVADHKYFHSFAFSLFREIGCTAFANYVYFNLTRILKFRLNLLRYVVSENNHLVIGYLLRLDEDSDLAARLDRE